MMHNLLIYSSQLKSKIDNILTKDVTLRIVLNIDVPPYIHSF
jgi:hypothetical protein